MVVVQTGLGACGNNDGRFSIFRSVCHTCLGEGYGTSTLVQNRTDRPHGRESPVKGVSAGLTQTGVSAGVSDGVRAGAYLWVSAVHSPGKMQHIGAISHRSLFLRGDCSAREATEGMPVTFSVFFEILSAIMEVLCGSAVQYNWCRSTREH